MTTMRSITATIVLPALLVAVLAGCGSTTAAAATVNGAGISDEALRSELEIMAEHPDFARAFLGWSPEEPVGGRVDSEFAAQVLTIRIILELVDQEIQRRGIVIDDELLAAAEATFEAPLLEILDPLPAEYRASFLHWNAQLLALRDAIAEEEGLTGLSVSDEEVRSFFDESSYLFGDEVCASHILVEQESEAEELRERLDAGEEFAELARVSSTDPSAAANSGSLGCNPAGTFVPAFDEVAWSAPLGEVVGPVETEFGFHLILVHSRGPIEFEEVEAEIRAFMESELASQPQVLLNDLVMRLIQEASITVSSRYGSWDPELGQVIPPEGPLDATG